MRPADNGSDESRPEGPESFANHVGPKPEPAGSLVPPPWKPPTAVGAAAEPPPLNPKGFREAWRQRTWRRDWIGATVSQLLDSVDELADRIATQLGLRERS
jgi:hypothetical protein